MRRRVARSSLIAFNFVAPLCLWSTFPTVAAGPDCSPLDPRASSSTAYDTKIEGSLDTLYKIAKGKVDIEHKAKSEMQNLQQGVPVSGQDLVRIRTQYLWCTAYGNDSTIDPEAKARIYSIMMGTSASGANIQTVHPEHLDPVPDIRGRLFRGEKTVQFAKNVPGIEGCTQSTKRQVLLDLDSAGSPTKLSGQITLMDVYQMAFTSPWIYKGETNGVPLYETAAGGFTHADSQHLDDYVSSTRLKCFEKGKTLQLRAVVSIYQALHGLKYKETVIALSDGMDPSLGSAGTEHVGDAQILNNGGYVKLDADTVLARSDQ